MIKYNCIIFKNILGALKSPTALVTITVKRSLLKSTKIKLIKSYDDQVKTYINENLRLEYKKLQEIESNQDRVESINRLNHLKNLLEIEAEISRKEIEINDLKKFINTQECATESDQELLKLVKSDLDENLVATDDLKLNFIDLLVKDDIKEDQENATIELHAGVGGQEAMLFCKELFEMYRGYAGYRGWEFIETNMSETDIGGSREAIAEIRGRAVFKNLKFESGVHRVQRVPQTERTGRVHTSTVTVCILPKPDEIKIDLNPKDLIYEACRSRGPGGQHVNKTESACRITHTPSGVVVFCQESRQHNKNRQKALEILKLKLYQSAFEKALSAQESNRRLQVSSAARSERIRTYNYLQDRISDHRIEENFHNIESFLLGTDSLDELITSLKQTNLPANKTKQKNMS